MKDKKGLKTEFNCEDPAICACAYTDAEKALLGYDYAEFTTEYSGGVYREKFDPYYSVAAASEVKNFASGSRKGNGVSSVKRGKAARFFAAYWSYFAAPLFIFISFFITLAAYNVYPFSDKTTIANYDLLAQICPFIEHFYDVFDGKSSLFYSTAIIGGADVFGSLAYCLISPFTPLFLLFGKGRVYYAVSFVLPLKLACIACSAIFFIKKHFKNIPAHVGLILALLYAYCGYTFVANTYINWLDFLIYMPFVVTGFKKLVTENKIKYFSVSYALMIYACFSIASFALLLIYLMFMAYAFICVDKANRREVIFKICLSLVIAVALAMPVMLPSFIAYTKSGRNTGLFSNMANPLSDNHLKVKISYIITDAACLFLTLAYLIKSRLKRREDVFYLLIGLLIMMPVLIDEVCNLLNAGSYMSYALRFGFLNSTYAFYLSCKLLNQAENKRISRNRSIIGTVLFGIAALAAIIFIIYYAYSIVEGDVDNFSGGFAHSLGGLSVIAVFAAVVFGATAIAFVFYKTKLSPYKALSVVLICVFATQISVFNVFLIKGNLFNPVRYDQYNYIANAIKTNYESDGAYYRIKDYDDAISNAAALTTHTNGFSVFSSMVDAKNLTATKFFGYGGNKINSIKSKGGLYFGDALLGYKYYYILNDSYKNNGQKTHACEKRTYNELLPDTVQPYFQGVRNNLCFQNAFTTTSGDLIFGDDYYRNMTKLYNFLGGEGELFDYYDIDTPSITYDEETGVYMAKIYTLDEGQWYMTHDFPEEYDIRYSLSAYSEENSKILTADSVINFNYYKKAKRTYFYCYLKNYGETPLTAQDVAKYCKGACLPLYKLQNIKENLDERAAELKIVNGNRFEIKANAETDGEYLFLNFVAIDGFDVVVNGKSAEFIDNGLDMMIVKLDKGDNEVIIEYNSPYVLYLIIGVFIAVATCFAAFYLNRSKRKIRGVAVNAVFVSAIILGAFVFGFFIGYPTVVFFGKLIKLIF